MKNIEVAKAAFNQKLYTLNKLAKPTHLGQNLNAIVLYEKLLEIEEQVTKLVKKVDSDPPMIIKAQ